MYRAGRFLAAVAMAATCALVVLVPGSRDVLVIGSVLSTVIAAGIALRRPGPLRPAVGVFFGAICINTVGTTLSGTIGRRYNGLYQPNVGDVIVLSSYPLIVWSLMLTMKANRRRPDVRSLIDAFVVGLAGANVLWATLVHPIAVHTDSTVSRMALVAYPACDLVITVLVARMAFEARKGASALGLIAIGMGFSFVADIGSGAARATNHSAGAVIVIAQVATFLCITLLFGTDQLDRLADLDLDGERAHRLRLVMLALAAVSGPVVALAVPAVRTEACVFTLCITVMLLLRGIDMYRDLAATGSRWVESLVQRVSDLVLVASPSGTITYASSRTAEVFDLDGVASRHGASVHLSSLAHPDDRPRLHDAFEAACRGRETVEVELRLTVDGVARFHAMRLTGMLEDPAVNGIVVNANDVDDLRRMASYDALTGLVNRSWALHHLDQLLSTGRRPSALLVDLDGFKEVNDSFGHGAGDDVLREVARRIADVGASCDRPTVVARLGGDEFLLVTADPDHEDVAPLCERLISAVSAPITVDGLSFVLGASIGARNTDGVDDGSITASDVLRDADVALYEAKRLGKGRAIPYEGSMGRKLRERVELRAALDRGLESGELSLVYQPKFDLASGALIGFETLARWRRADGQFVSPGLFIPVAEETGQIIVLGRWALDRALGQLHEWDLRFGCTSISMAVNVSTRQLADMALVDDVVYLLGAHDIAPGRLTLEITETALMGDPERALAILGRLHDHGVHLSVDDYGAGNASIGYLRNFPLDEVKIDRTLVVSLLEEAEVAEPFIRSIVELARVLGLRTVAEGIEEEAQLSALRRLGCDVAQGYLLGRPAGPADAATFIGAAVPPSLRPTPADAVPARPYVAGIEHAPQQSSASG